MRAKVNTDNTITYSRDPELPIYDSKVETETYSMTRTSIKTIMVMARDLAESLALSSDEEVLSNFRVGTANTIDNNDEEAKQLQKLLEDNLNPDLFRKSVFNAVRDMELFLEKDVPITYNPSKYSDMLTLQGICIVIESYIQNCKKETEDKIGVLLYELKDEVEAAERFDINGLKGAMRKANHIKSTLTALFFTNLYLPLAEVSFTTMIVAEKPKQIRKIRTFMNKYENVDVETILDKVQIETEVKENVAGVTKQRDDEQRRVDEVNAALANRTKRDEDTNGRTPFGE